jgi:hypothetical protein
MGKEYTRSFGTIGQASPYGPIILFDDYEATLFKWTAALGGAGSAVDRFTTDAKDGLASMRLITATTPAIGNSVGATRNIYERPSRTYTLETEFNFNIQNSLNRILFQLLGSNSTNDFQWGAEIDDVTNVVRLIDSTGIAANFSGNALDLLANVWHRLTLSANFNTGRYEYLSIDGQEFQVSNVSLRNVAGGGALNQTLTCYIELGVATQTRVLIDNILLREGGQQQ